ncbi:MAG: hypothetical protein OES13_12065 [Acidimicrobiia bacterium]|nr:hypothetical protein [Acidimicrobiia bacterium]
MKLDTLNATYVSNTSNTVTFRFECNARLDASDEAAEVWGLEVKWIAHGRKRIRAGNRYLPAPDTKSGTEVVSPGQQPEGLGQGDVWKPVFEHGFPKGVILVQDNDQYIFNARLVPLILMNLSNYRTDVVVRDID